MLTSQKAFTIVELLIVIVVIAILASISIVSYNGVQSRAATSAGKQLANQMVEKVTVYKVLNGAYPPALSSMDAYPETRVEPGTIYVDCNPWTTTTHRTTPAPSSTYPGGAANGKTVRFCGNTAGGNAYYWDYSQNIEVAVPYT